jgi:hypothetical protein
MQFSQNQPRHAPHQCGFSANVNTLPQFLHSSGFGMGGEGPASISSYTPTLLLLASRPQEEITQNLESRQKPVL